MTESSSNSSSVISLPKGGGALCGMGEKFSPQLVAEPQRMVVKLLVGRDDFPSNLENIRIRYILLYFSRADGMTQEILVEHLKLVDPLGHETSGGSARTIDGTISTRRGNGSPWLPLIGGGAGLGAQQPFGTWELSLRNSNAGEAQQLKDAFDKDLIDDILLVVSYEGDTPSWPK